MKKKSSKNISRRQFLSHGAKLVGSSALLNSPLAILLDAILRGQVNQALATASGAQPRRWVDFRFDNSPPRFVYDLFLINSQADRTNFVASPKHVFTKFVETAGRYTQGVYEVHELEAQGKSPKEIWAPWIWTRTVPAPGGGTRPMSDLLQHLLHIRGIDTGNPGHNGSRTLHYLPLGALQSITAMSADGSQAPIAAVFGAAADYTYRSLANTTPFQVSGTNLAQSLLAPFNPRTSVSVVRGREALVRTYLDNTRAALQTHARSRHPDAEIIHRAIAGSRELFGFSFATLDAQWTTLVNKYQDLVTRALGSTIVGINDKPIGVDPESRDASYQLNGPIVRNADLRSLMTGADIPTMARAFAIAEFILLNNLSDSLTLGLGEMMVSATFTTGGNPAIVRSVFDEHTTGGMVSTLVNAMYSVAHAACLSELVAKIVQSGEWNRTIINCSGEFNRSPQANGAGSDHNYWGASLALYSGMINGPFVLGDIARNPIPTAYPGTWGKSVPQSGAALDNTVIDAGNAAATIAQLIGVRSPLTAREPLVYANGNSITPRIPKGKIT